MATQRDRLTALLRLFLGALFFIQLTFPPSGFAADLWVGTLPGDYPTIADALADASDGDRIILRQGTYHEDVTLDTPGIELLSDFGTTPILEGNITVTAAAGGVLISGVNVAPGRSISVESGIEWPASLPAGSQNWTFAALGQADGVSIMLGDVKASGVFTNVLGANIITGANSAIHHTGAILVDSLAPDSSARGAAWITGDYGQATLGSVDVRAGKVSIGTHYFTGNHGKLTVSGDVYVLSRESGSSATGVGVRGQSGVGAELEGETRVEGGSIAVGLDFNVSADGHLTHSGHVNVNARETGSEGYGLLLGAGDNLTATLAHITVEAGETARGVTTTYPPGSVVVTEGIENDADIRITGSVLVTARDTESEAYGVDLQVLENLWLSVGSVEATGGRLAQGIQLKAADGGSLTHAGDLTATARHMGSQAYGLNVSAGNGFFATVGNVTARSGLLARAVDLTVHDDGRLVVEGDLSATSAGGSSQGILAVAGDRFEAMVRNVEVKGGGGAVQGVSLNAGDNGSLRHEGLIQVTGTAPTSIPRGLNIIAGENFTATIGDIAVSGPRSALGVSWSSSGGATLIHTGTISAAATGENGNAGGATVLSGDRLTFRAADIAAEALGLNSNATGIFVQAGQEVDASFASVSAKGTTSATGLTLLAGDEATLHAGQITATASEAGSTASGAVVQTGQGLTAVLGDVAVTGGDKATGISLEAAEFSLEVGSVTAQAGSDAVGILVSGQEGAVTVHGDVSAMALGGTGAARGLTVESPVADVTNHGRIQAAAATATAVAFGESAAAERITFHNVGVVETAATAGAAVAVNVTGTATVQNEGSLNAGDRVAFDGSASTGSIFLANVGLGTIAGDVVLGLGADEFVLEGNASVLGRVNLGAGDDDATIHYGGVITGFLDGGPGDDSLTLVGAGASSLPAGSLPTWITLRHIEQVQVSGGAWQWGPTTVLGVVDVGDAYLRIDDDVTVAELRLQDGALEGQGNVTGSVVNSGGVLSPGSSYGILTITGNYTQGKDGVLYIELDASAPPAAGVNHDQLIVSGGTAVFEEGTTVRVRPVYGPSLPRRLEYIIVDGDVVFDPETINLAIESSRLFYSGWLEPGSMKLVLGHTPFSGVSETPNQKSVGDALTDAQELPGTVLDELYDWLSGLDPDQAKEANAAYDLLSGEVYSHLPTLAARRLDHIASAIGRGIPQLPVQGRGSVWALPYADWGRVVEGEGTAPSEFHQAGVVAGADLISGSSARFGLSIGGGWDRLTMDARASKLQGQTRHFGLYGHFTFGPARVTTSLGYSTTTHQAQRTIRFGTVERRAEAEFDSTERVAAVEARFAVSALGGFKIEPVASVRHYSASYRPFQERGAGPLGLIADEKDAAWWQGRVALEATGRPRAVFGAAHLRTGVAWVRDFTPVERRYTGRLQGAKETPFTIHGTKAHQSGLEASLGLHSDRGGDLTWSLDYTGAFRQDTSNHRVMARITLEF